MADTFLTFEVIRETADGRFPNDRSTQILTVEDIG